MSLLLEDYFRRDIRSRGGVEIWRNMTYQWSHLLFYITRPFSIDMFMAHFTVPHSVQQLLPANLTVTCYTNYCLTAEIVVITDPISYRSSKDVLHPFKSFPLYCTLYPVSQSVFRVIAPNMSDSGRETKPFKFVTGKFLAQFLMTRNVVIANCSLAGICCTSRPSNMRTLTLINI